MQVLTVRNRHNKPFTGVYDGVKYTIPEHGQMTLLRDIAIHLKQQSIFKSNPISGEKEYRLAIVEDGDEDTPLDSLPQETLDRTDMDLNKTKIVVVGNRPAVPVRGVGGNAITAKER